MLPLAALAGTAAKIGETEVKAVELKPEKRYVFKVNADMTQEEMDCLKDKVVKAGYGDVLLISGAVDLYEMVRSE